MTKLITAWALAAVLSAVLAYKIMTPKQAPPAAKTQFSLFGWHNEGRPVVNAGGTTDNVHPYNKEWGQLVTRQDRLSYE